MLATGNREERGEKEHRSVGEESGQKSLLLLTLSWLVCLQWTQQGVPSPAWAEPISGIDAWVWTGSAQQSPIGLLHEKAMWPAVSLFYMLG